MPSGPFDAKVPADGCASFGEASPDPEAVGACVATGTGDSALIGGVSLTPVEQPGAKMTQTAGSNPERR